MNLIRDQFQTRYGQVSELLQLFQRFRVLMQAYEPMAGFRVLTDILAPLNTVTTEFGVDKLEDYMVVTREQFTWTEFKVWFNQMQSCTDSGTREFYNVVVPPLNARGTAGQVMVRNVYHARYGKADYLVEHMKREADLASRYHIPPASILTDLSGPMYTIVTTRDYASLAAYEKGMEVIMSEPEYSEWRRGLLVAVESGRREMYRIEA
jgi:hypothetical protein